MAGEDIRNWIAERFAAELAAAFEATAEEKPAVECAPGAPAGEEIFWWEQELSCAPEASIVVGAPRESWVVLGGKVLAAAGIESTDEDARGTWQEMLGQAFSALASALGARAGTEVHTRGGREAKAPEADDTHCVDLRFKDGSTAAVWFHASPAVVRAIEPPPAEEAKTGVEPQQALAPVSMDLLLDVELPVTVVFGRALLRLQEVLKLSSGSIIDLDRTIAQPVDIVVNNCVIARGEVVVVEGNYGVRISEIVSRTERLRTSRRSLNTVRRGAA